jgi:hypothetical protein
MFRLVSMHSVCWGWRKVSSCWRKASSSTTLVPPLPARNSSFFRSSHRAATTSLGRPCTAHCALCIALHCTAMHCTLCIVHCALCSAQSGTVCGKNACFQEAWVFFHRFSNFNLGLFSVGSHLHRSISHIRFAILINKAKNQRLLVFGCC